MFENLRKLYRHYGGVNAIVKSSYFWVSILLAALSYQSIWDFGWADKAVSIMPSLTGFTIAAFAIIFAVLEPAMLRKLMATDGHGRSPIAGIATSIGHAVFIQVSAMILAISSKLVDLSDIIPIIANWIYCKEYSLNIIHVVINYFRLFFSTLGLFFTYYGVMLVLAAILSIVRTQLIVADATKITPPTRENRPD